MGKYRKRTVEVEAEQVTNDNAYDVAQWCGGRVVEEIGPVDLGRTYGINVPTLEGPERASQGDYVVKGQHGEFFTCKQHAFQHDFEKAE